jgi:SAM-dependent methyltransferase
VNSLRGLPNVTVSDQDAATARLHRAYQAHHFDHVIKDPEFEVSRPRGGGRFYAYLMEFKIGTTLRLLEDSVSSARVLDICVGSGMDAELLTQQGALVVGLDISFGALLRAKERAQRYGLKYLLVAGDAEQLPFRSDAFDYAFVHDGLHHLDEPHRALAEMARVSYSGVALTEPADAWVTGLAVKLHIIPEREDSGNKVYRLHPTRLGSFFASLGLPVTRSQRYLVKYPHRPGSLFHSLGLPVVFPLARAAFEIVGVGLLGRLGNKLSFVALKAPDRG